MKKIFIFITIFVIIISTFIFSASAEQLDPLPNYFLTVEGSTVAYPVYDTVEQSNYLNIGLRQVYGYDTSNFIMSNYNGSKIKISIFENNDNIQVFYAEHNGSYWDEPIEVYNGRGDDVVISVQEFPAVGIVNSYSIEGSEYVESLTNLNPSLVMLNILNIQNLPEGYTLYELPDIPIESTPVETEPLEPTPTLPPYTMPDDIVNTTKDAFGNFIVGIGGVTLEGYEALFFKEGTLTNIGTCFLVIIGVCFACFILTWIFKRGKNE